MTAATPEAETKALVPTSPSRTARGAPPWLRALAAALGQAGRAVGRALAAGYRGVDPDVRSQLASMPLVGLPRLFPVDDGIEPRPDDGRRPILLVHGLGGHPADFTPMRLWLRLRGRRRVHAVRLPSGVSMDELAGTFAAHLAGMARAYDLVEERSVDVIAHSMGGLVVRRALDDPDTARWVATLCTLGTPHAGTYSARFADTVHTRSLRPGSVELGRFAAQLPWSDAPPRPRMVCFWSSSDVFLLPHHAAQVEGAENEELPGYHHLSYLLRPTCWDRILDRLDEGHSPGS